MSGRPVSRACAARVAERRFGAGLDLAGVDDAAKPPARVLLGEVHDPDRRLELAPPARLVPVEPQLVPVRELPVRVGEERADVDPKAAPASPVEPPFDGAGEVRHRGDSGEEELRVGHLHRRLAAGLVEGEGAGAFVEPGVVHLGDPVVLAHALARGLGMGVGVEIDEPRHDESPRAVDGAAGGALVAAPDVDDAVGGERDVAAAEVLVLAAVPRRDPGRVADYGGVLHGSFPPRFGAAAGAEARVVAAAAAVAGVGSGVGLGIGRAPYSCTSGIEPRSCPGSRPSSNHRPIIAQSSPLTVDMEVP